MNASHRTAARRPAVFRPLQGLILLMAWLCATGSHWDVVQTVAWARMWYRAVQTESMSAALESTFVSGAKCRLCAAVEKGRTESAAANDELLRHPERPLLLITWADGEVILRPVAVSTPADVWAIPYAGRSRREPPAPPPRVERV